MTTPAKKGEGEPLLHQPQKTQLPRQQDQEKKLKRSFLPWLVAMELSFTTHWILNGLNQGTISSMHQAAILLTVPLLQGLWTAITVVLGHRNWFTQDCVLESFPMIWLPLFPIVIQTTIFYLQWETVSQLIESSYPSILVLQGLRVLAVGSLVKWHLGLFPTAFGWGTAFPDMLFGLSAWVLWMFSDAISWQLLAVWNTFGLLLILPVGILIVQLGMKPTRVYVSTAPYKLVFEYPMVLGPAVVVPILLSWNILLMRLSFEKLR